MRLEVVYNRHCRGLQPSTSLWKKVSLSRTINQPEDSLTSRRFIITMLGVSLALFLIPQVPLAAEDHIAEAITHTNQAIDHGKMGHADVLTTHAEAALGHAQAGEKAKANPHTEEAIKHLKQAIDEGKKGHADAATTHAEAALTHLEQVK
jgi:Small metal-binding protein